jgi:fucose permease
MQIRSGHVRGFQAGIVQITLTYFVAFVTLGLVNASLGPTIPALAEQVGVGLNQIGILFAARSFGYLIGTYVTGRQYDHRDGHPLMGASLLLMAAAMFLAPRISLLWLLALMLVLVGLGEGSLDVGGNTLLVWMHGKRVDAYMNGMHFCFGMGAFLAPMAVAWVSLRTGEIAWAYGLIALALLPIALLLLGLPSPRPQAAAPDSRTVPRLDPKLVALVVAFFGLYVGAEVSFGGWIYSYAVDTGMMDAQTAAYVTSGFWAAFTLARLASIPLGGRVSARSLLGFDFLGAFLSLLLLAILPGFAWALWAGALGFGFFIASVFPTMLTYAGQRMPATGKVTGYFFFGSNVGGMILPWLAGQFMEQNAPALIWILLVDMMLALVVLVAIAARRA